MKRATIQRINGYARRKRNLRLAIALLIERDDANEDAEAEPDIAAEAEALGEAHGFTAFDGRFELRWQLGMYDLDED